eukprot:2992890-Rhodomonas_salina.5
MRRGEGFLSNSWQCPGSFARIPAIFHSIKGQLPSAGCREGGGEREGKRGSGAVRKMKEEGGADGDVTL